ncbi:hypothetical protein ACWD0G_31680 [Streptomyces goshikiensis]
MTTPEPAGPDEVRALARDGRIVEAVRVYRRVTGADLREVKRAVEALQRAPAGPPVGLSGLRRGRWRA